MKINVKISALSHGLKHSGLAELPPEAKTAPRNSISLSLNKCLDKIILNGFEMRRAGWDGRGFHEDMIRVVENNGQVTLPVSSEPWLSRRQIKWALAFLAAAAAVAFVVAV